MFFFPVTLGVMSEAGKELEGAGAESDSRPQNGCAAPGGSSVPWEGTRVGVTAWQRASFNNKLDVLYVQNLLKGVGGGAEGGSATGFVCFVLVL